MKVINCKALYINIIIMIYFQKVLANFVPAAAVKRKGQALFGLIGRKAYVGGKLNFNLNSKFYFQYVIKMIFQSLKEDYGTLSVTVKCIDI